MREAAARALRDGRIGYTDALGLPALREAIAGTLLRTIMGSMIDPARIAVTTGSSAAFNLAFLAYFDPGDRVAITRPGYPAYRNILKALGLEVVEIATAGAEGAALNAELSARRARRGAAKGRSLREPGQPDRSRHCRGCAGGHPGDRGELGITVISDEIYHRLAYDAPDTTALAFDDCVTVINSFSKYYCMTGWRIGWMVSAARRRPSDRDGLRRASTSRRRSFPRRRPSRAFEAAAELEAVKQRYRESRALLMDRLPAIGLDLAAPMAGAFYAYCDVSRFTNDSMEFAARMIAEANVAATPGFDFDPLEGHRFMRFSYAGKVEEMAEAMKRLDTWLA